MENDYLKNIKSIRISKGISQKDMANKLEFAQSNYNKIENGLAELTVKRLYEIAEILGVSIFQILIEKDVELLQEKIRVEIENKQKKEFDNKKIEEIKTKYQDEFAREIGEVINKMVSTIGEKFRESKPLPDTPERIAKREKENEEQLKKRFEKLESKNKK